MRIDQDRLHRWMTVYSEKLLAAVASGKYQYSYPVSEVPKVVARMRDAFEAGSYSKDGRATEQTCKHFGIPYTYKAINSFLSGEPY